MNIKEYLRECGVPFEIIPHRRAEGASQLARAVHESGKHVAKTVLLRVNHGYRDVVAILPSHLRVDPQQASKLLGGAQVRLGTEDDLALHCPDCERGVLPPFGSHYNLGTIADEALTEEEELVFEGNRHDEAIRLKWADFRRIESPIIGRFAVAEHVRA